MSRTPTREGYQPNRGKRQGKPPKGGTAVVSRFDRDEVVLRVECPPPPSDDKDTGTPSRDGRVFPRLPVPHWSKDSGWPPSGPNRYRIARKGNLYRVEVWRCAFFIGAEGWHRCYRAGPPTTSLAIAQMQLRERQNAAQWPDWIPVDLAGGSGEG